MQAVEVSACLLGRDPTLGSDYVNVEDNNVSVDLITQLRGVPLEDLSRSRVDKQI